ncbi:hypothetical protein Glove_227g112 [Diversispora epigaea]|uniref:Uncharacterized protein n=1 Tax=Diversispora epigaea TaxID=1348612 RepID=A0A397IMC9_9GLOM|nr:hypothetical protein Glove_227g112 [Diversispora epigaea]
MRVLLACFKIFFKVPNGGVFFHPSINVFGQPFHDNLDGSGVKIAPVVAVYPGSAFVLSPDTSTIRPRPPSDVDGNPHARIMCEVAVSRSVGSLKQRCLTWIANNMFVLLSVLRF